MKNKVNTIVFPLTKNYSLHGNRLYNDNSVSVFCVSTCLDTLKKAATLSRKHGLAVQANRNISVHSSMETTYIEPKTWRYTLERTDTFVPELCQEINYEWLLGQVKMIEEGATYTESCLLCDDRLVVFNGEPDDRRGIPTLLIKGLSKTVSTLLKDKEKFTTLSPPSAWRYLTDLVTSSKEDPYKAKLSDKAKLLIADMKLRGTEGTTMYHLLQGVSSIVAGLQQKQAQKLP